MRAALLAVLAGLMLAATPAESGPVVYSYDNMGRIKTATYGNGPQVVYSYDDAGNWTLVATQSGTNAPPQANNDYITTVEGIQASVSPLSNDSDPNNDGLTLTSVGTPHHGTASKSGSTVTYMPNSGYVGPDDFTTTISDGSLSASATVYVTVLEAPAPPIAVNDVVTTPANTAKNFDPRNNDTMPTPPTYITAVSTPAHGSATRTNTSVTYTPGNGYAGPDSFTYTITDPDNQPATATVNVTVGAPPVAVSDYMAAPSDTTVTFDPRVNDSDPNGLPLTILSVTGEQHGSAVVNSGGTSVSYTRNHNYRGKDSFTYTLTDGQLSSTATDYICAGTVLPNAATDSLMAVGQSSPNNPVYGYGSANILANDTDDCLQGPVGLTVTSVTQGVLGYDHVDDTGTASYSTRIQYDQRVCTDCDSFTYTVTDPFGSSATGTVNVSIDIENTGN